MGIGIARGREGWFLFVFSVFFVAWLIPVVLNYATYNPPGNGNWTAILTAVGRAMGPIAVLTAIVTVTLIEGGSMLSERFKKRRFEEGRQEGRQEAANAWREWNERREEAARRGQPFNDPPPDLK